MALAPVQEASPRAVKAVFLDKDGTLIENLPYNVDPGRMRFAKGAVFCLRLLHDAGYGLVVVSNQSGVARGFFPESALDAVKERLTLMCLQIGVPLLDFCFCPHHPEGIVAEYAVPCLCRKPAPGLILHAARRHGIDLASSWLIGDILDDIAAGRKAGCRTILINNGSETRWLLSGERIPDYFVADLAEAALVIVARDKDGTGHARRGAA
ncbi:MAG: HAD family hydrolase [Syntrophorhabdales bacterium]|jgi:histidinol-phosphate phosphatase family protein